MPELKMNEKINRLTARFALAETEARYKQFIQGDSLKIHRWAIGLAIVFYSIYSIYDFNILTNHILAIEIRLAAAAIAGGFLLLMFQRAFAHQYENLSCLAVLFMGAGVNLIIAIEPNLDNTYHVAFIQGAVFVCFFLRVDFLKSALVMMTYLAGIVIALSGKAQTEEVVVQPFVLFTMFLVCGFGSYLIQIIRRNDFLKTQKIEIQNEQLNSLLEEAQLDNERKIAALNLLVHFIKTPLHQITGFSDILVNSIGGAQGGESVENAKYIKNATVNLTKSVNGLLNYHRLDEIESRNAPEPVDMTTIVEDFAELLPGGVEFSKGEVAKGSVSADPEIVRAALRGFTDHYSEERNGATRVVASASNDDGAMTLTIRDDACILSSAQYEDLVQPLTQIKTYLSQSGDEMAMSLRTVARAVEIAGGDLAHAALADGNRYVLKFPAAAARAAAA